MGEADTCKQGLRQGFSTLALLTFWAREFFVVRGSPKHRRIFSTIPGLWKFYTSSTAPCPVVRTKNVSWKLGIKFSPLQNQPQLRIEIGEWREWANQEKTCKCLESHNQFLIGQLKLIMNIFSNTFKYTYLIFLENSQALVLFAWLTKLFLLNFLLCAQELNHRFSRENTIVNTWNKIQFSPKIKHNYFLFNLLPSFYLSIPKLFAHYMQ